MTKAQIMKEVWSRIGIYSFCYTFEPINSKGEEYLKLACPNRKFKPRFPEFQPMLPL
jgi:hypothetical protein